MCGYPNLGNLASFWKFEIMSLTQAKRLKKPIARLHIENDVISFPQSLPLQPQSFLSLRLLFFYLWEPAGHFLAPLHFLHSVIARFCHVLWNSPCFFKERAYALARLHSMRTQSQGSDSLGRRVTENPLAPLMAQFFSLRNPTQSPTTPNALVFVQKSLLPVQPADTLNACPRLSANEKEGKHSGLGRRLYLLYRDAAKSFGRLLSERIAQPQLGWNKKIIILGHCFIFKWTFLTQFPFRKRSATHHHIHFMSDKHALRDGSKSNWFSMRKKV